MFIGEGTIVLLLEAGELVRLVLFVDCCKREVGLFVAVGGDTIDFLLCCCCCCCCGELILDIVDFLLCCKEEGGGEGGATTDFLLCCDNLLLPVVTG